MYRSYPLDVLEKLISDAVKNDYTLITISEGVLGIGHLFLIAPGPGYWNFEIKELSRNEWSSTNVLRRFRKVSKRIQKLIDNPEV